MSNFTEQAIRKAFIELLNEKPFDKVTVLDIAERCGINRNTFYYHYHDIYDLLDSILTLEEQSTWNDVDSDFASWKESLLSLTAWARENERAIKNIYRSISRDRVESYIFTTSQRIMERYIRMQASSFDLDERAIEDISLLYAATAEGLILNWLRGGMTEELEKFIGDIGTLFQDSTRMILAHVSSSR